MAKKLGLDTSTLTRNINKLEKKNLIDRKRDGYDRRIKYLFLTDSGEEIVKNIEKVLVDLNYSILNNIDLDKQEHLSSSLEKLVWSIDLIRN